MDERRWDTPSCPSGAVDERRIVLQQPSYPWRDRHTTQAVRFLAPSTMLDSSPICYTANMWQRGGTAACWSIFAMVLLGCGGMSRGAVGSDAGSDGSSGAAAMGSSSAGSGSDSGGPEGGSSASASGGSGGDGGEEPNDGGAAGSDAGSDGSSGIAMDSSSGGSGGDGGTADGSSGASASVDGSANGDRHASMECAVRARPSRTATHSWARRLFPPALFQCLGLFASMACAPPALPIASVVAGRPVSKARAVPVRQMASAGRMDNARVARARA